MRDFENFTSLFIQTQFPKLYLEEGPTLVAFLTSYYEWMEDSGNFVSESRKLLTYRDIDLTLDQYIKNFKRKYLISLPDTLIANKRQFIKFILDFYRAKGTPQGLEIFFKSIYNAAVEVYIPGADIIKPSDSRWKINNYIELDRIDGLDSIVGKKIVNNSGSASAIAENYIVTTTNAKVVNILYLSNVVGSFGFGEKIGLEGTTDFSTLPTIVGSLSFIVIDSNGRGTNYAVGDILSVSSLSGREAKAVVTSISGESEGRINFRIVNGGSGYTLANSVVTVAGGGGTGATFTVSAISDTTTATIFTDTIAPYTGTLLSGTFGFPKLPTADLSSVISSALSSNSYTYGTISGISGINRGTGYTSNPTVTVKDAVISTTGLTDSFGNLLGNNAIISGTAEINLVGSVTSVKILDSGYGFVDGEEISMTGISPINNNSITGVGYVLRQGRDAGRWITNNSNLDEDKYIQDSRYYQEYSYEVRTKVPEVEYKNVILSTMHPTGTALFPKFAAISEAGTVSTVEESSIS